MIQFQQSQVYLSNGSQRPTVTARGLKHNCDSHNKSKILLFLPLLSDNKKIKIIRVLFLFLLCIGFNIIRTDDLNHVAALHEMQRVTVTGLLSE